MLSLQPLQAALHSPWLLHVPDVDTCSACNPHVSVWLPIQSPALHPCLAPHLEGGRHEVGQHRLDLRGRRRSSHHAHRLCRARPARQHLRLPRPEQGLAWVGVPLWLPCPPSVLGAQHNSILCLPHSRQGFMQSWDFVLAHMLIAHAASVAGFQSSLGIICSATLPSALCRAQHAKHSFPRAHGRLSARARVAGRRLHQEAFLGHGGANSFTAW